jgi:hypothetical protein
VGLQRTTPTGALAFSAFFAALLLGGWALWCTANPLARVAACVAWVLGAALGAVVRQGGIVRDRAEATGTQAGEAQAKPAAA